MLKRLRGFAKVRYRGLAKNANRALTALAMVNLYTAARRMPALWYARIGSGAGREARLKGPPGHQVGPNQAAGRAQHEQRPCAVT